MKVTAKQYALTLLDISEGKSGEDLKKAILSFSKLVQDNNQINQLDKILYHFKNLYNQRYNIVEAQINTAHSLDKEQLTQIEEYLNNINKKKTVEFKADLKKDIIGGIVVKYGDKIIDSSLKTRIKQLKNSLLK